MDESFSQKMPLSIHLYKVKRAEAFKTPEAPLKPFMKTFSETYFFRRGYLIGKPSQEKARRERVGV